MKIEVRHEAVFGGGWDVAAVRALLDGACRVVLVAHTNADDNSLTLKNATAIAGFHLVNGTTTSLKIEASKPIAGDIKITIPQGIEYGKQLRVKGKGMPVYNVPNMYGDLYVKVKYTVPKNLSPEQLDLIRQAAEKK